ncbi:MAG: hypothetical protein OIF55_07020 [Amphritea sp.]|nr:hypothetical protein [Amphritea sp.]
MSEITLEDARAIAGALRKLSADLGEYRFANWDSLDESERSRIESLEWTLLNYSSDMTATSISIAVNNLQPEVDQIRSTVDLLQDAIGLTLTVSKVINIAAGVTALGAAIATGNLAAIRDAARAVRDALAEQDEQDE